MSKLKVRFTDNYVYYNRIYLYI